MKKKENEKLKKRIVLIGVVFSLLLVAIAARAAYLQIHCRRWLSDKASRQYEASLTSRGKRGVIYDAGHVELAVSIDATSVAAYPDRIKNKKKAARKLASSLRMDEKELIGRLSSKKAFVWIRRQITPKEKERIEELKMDGIDFIPEHCRFYPNRRLAAQVIGFSGIDGRGLEGIEFYYNSYLKGETGKRKVIKDAMGREFTRHVESDGSPLVSEYGGNHLVLTIDRAVQHTAERILEQTVEKYEGKSGMAVVMAPKTGAVLAMVNYPFYNPNVFSRFPRRTWRNRTVTDPFEPGSTLKIFSAAAAVQSERCSPESLFFCENGRYKIGKNIVHDANHSYGWLNLKQIIKFSSNIGAVKVGEAIGGEVLYQTLKKFGFGSKTGIDCPGETVGALSHFKNWSPIDLGAISFGQGISVSALQLITATCAIANGGLLMKPYLVQGIIDPHGRLIKRFGPKVIRQVVSAKTAATVAFMMKSVISEDGTGVQAAINGYSVCGKTGTAQKIDKTGRYKKGKYTASFIGFTPFKNSEIAVLVVVDEPQKEHYGGMVAAPAFKDMAREILTYKNIPPRENIGKSPVSI